MSKAMGAEQWARLKKRQIALRVKTPMADWRTHRNQQRSANGKDTPALALQATAPLPSSPFFILGHPRSGTTLFREILNRHPALFIPPENGSIESMYDAFISRRNLSWDQAVDGVLDAFKDGYQFKFWCSDLPSLKQQALALPSEEQSFARLFDLIYRDFAGETAVAAKCWGDKSTPGYFSYLPKIEQTFPAARYIHLIRDGRDCAVSCVKAGFYSKSHVVAANAWTDNMYYCRRLARRVGERYLSIRYEDLTDEPTEWIKKVCQFLELDFHPSMLETTPATTENNSGKDYVAAIAHHPNVRKPISKSYAGKWKTELPAELIDQIQAITRNELAREGYH